MQRLHFLKPGRPRTLFAKMWHSVLALMLVSFLVNAFLVTATLQLGSEAQTERRLTRIADHWSAQAPLREPLAIDPVTVIYPSYPLLPPKIQRLLPPEARGLFELGSRAEDYFVMARPDAAGRAFYVVEYHAEVKPTETIEHQVFVWYLAGIAPVCVGLLWWCKRISARVTAPMQEVGRQVLDRSPDSLAPLALPAGSSVELQALVEQINSALQRTADVLERERRFTQFASHELRTPAAVMQTALERIEVHARPEQARAIERAHRGLRDMHALVDTFLQLSTDGSRATRSATTVVDRAWLQELLLHVAGGQPDRELIVDAQAPLALEAPATLVQVLVGNLLKNAMFHGAPGPIHVHLTGQGMEMRNNVRDEPSTPGFGLGCQIVRRICDRCGWTFELRLTRNTATAVIRVPDAGATTPASAAP
ncbi:sensor histidine kinase [Aquincola tertiaricarbonis]|uniref:sensor histidine kinase n=1 Tax=Aquincola tertiaricarbonis TaxID=391953 RepID=UPI000614EB34|nr:HAMP domain-containing sensor histidine kinase [Aquincola tertiaricarbonis]